MLKNFTLVFLFFAPVFLMAQEEDRDDNPFKVAYWQVGYQGNIGDFDFSLPTQPNLQTPYPELESLVNNFSFTVGSRSDRVDGFFTFYGGENEVSRSDEGNSSRYRQGGVGMGIAFNVIGENQGNWFLGPELTTNFQFAQVVLADRVNVNTILNIPMVEYYKINQFSIPIDLGLQFGKRLTNPETKRFWIFSLRGGYRLASDDDWELDGALPVQIFPVSTQGFYFGLSVGRGGLSRD